MGLLDNLERGLEKAVRSAFSVGGSQAVKPVEIATALRQAMDDESVSVTEGRMLAPNSFTVHVGPDDLERARAWGSALAQQLCDEVIRYADSQDYTLAGTVRVAFHEDDEVHPGRVEVEPEFDDGSASSHTQPHQPLAPEAHTDPDVPTPAPAAGSHAVGREEPVPGLLIEGVMHALHDADTVVGRSHERADLVLADSSVSREHVRLERDADLVRLVDLGSRNGVRVNGQRVNGTFALQDGDEITLGQSTMLYRADHAPTGSRA